MTLDEQLEILQAAKRGEGIEYFHNKSWWLVSGIHQFNFSEYDYRIADPYAELKAAAKDSTKQIRPYNGAWIDSDQNGEWEWRYPPNQYEIRDKPKDKKVVKYLCWDNMGALLWRHEESVVTAHWKRRPAFDKECEVEDE